MVVNLQVQKDDVIVEEIITGARTLFEKFGLKKTTMEDIASYIGKSKSSLYYYFPSKYEIFEAVLSQEIDELFTLASKAIEKATTAKDKLKAYSKVRLVKISKMGNLSQIVKNDLMDNLNVIIKTKKKHEATQFNMIREIIASGVDSGEFKKIRRADIDLLAYLFTATFTGISMPWCSDHQFPNIAQRVDVIVDVMVEGIGR
ncbi:MAG TPA: TetR/AcrR family transcriptional regulator [Puia sp.]|nr:TetR/AcrR family transcriptional regulator [Puia sp.]